MINILKEMYEFYFYMFYVPIKYLWWMDKDRHSSITIFFLTIPQILNLFTLFLYLVQFGSEFKIILFLGFIAIYVFNIKFYGKNDGDLRFIANCKKLSISRKIIYSIINISYLIFSIWLIGFVEEKYRVI